jgi:heme/copper-type cytochrome/quinol oxidase subunit 2
VNYLPFIVAGIAFVVFLTLGIVTWSYRDVANRHSEKTDGARPHDSGH